MRALTRRRLGVWPLAATIFFIVSGGPYSTEQIVGKSGPLFALLVLCALPLIWSLPVGLMTAELSSRFPEEGGYFVWVENAFGPFAGFLCAWWSWTSSWVDTALYPVIGVQYATRLLHIGHPHSWVVGIILLFTAWNMLGIGKVGALSNAFLLILLVPFVVIVGFGIAKWATHPPTLPLLNPKAELSGIGAAMVFGLWNYFGWDSVTTTLGEIEGASKRLPKAMLLALALVTAMVVLPVAAGIALKTDWPSWDSDSGYWPEIAGAAWAPPSKRYCNRRLDQQYGPVQCQPPCLFSHPVRAFPGRSPAEVRGQRTSKVWNSLGRDSDRRSSFSPFGTGLSRKTGRHRPQPLPDRLDVGECAALVVLRKRAVAEPGIFQIGGGKFGLLLCAAAPILIGIIAIGLQLSPSTKLADTSVSPILILVALISSGPLVYGFRKLVTRGR